MSLYRAYRAERNSGKTHAQIVEDGIFGRDVHEYGLKYSQEIAIYQDYMQRQECDNRGALDVFGNPLREGT